MAALWTHVTFEVRIHYVRSECFFRLQMRIAQGTREHVNILCCFQRLCFRFLVLLLVRRHIGFIAAGKFALRL